MKRSPLTTPAERDYIEVLANAHNLQAGYESIDDCSPGSRTTIINDLLTSLRDTSTNQPKILWLQGSPGSGKSAIAATVCRLLDETGHLAGSIFASRLSERARNPCSIFAALASELTRFPLIGDMIWEAIKKNPHIRESSAPTQFSELIVRPLSAIDSLHHPFAIVLDGLDELTEPQVVLTAITAVQHSLPSFLKIFFTSRPEESIRTEMDAMGAVVDHLTLDHDRTMEDIGAFISQRTKAIAHRYIFYPVDWPGDIARRALVHASDGSFVWASTAMMFIEDENVKDPQSQLQFILELDASTHDHSSDIGSLYALVMMRALSSEQTVASTRKVLGAVITVQCPTTAEVLSNLLGFPRGVMSITNIVRRLKPVLFITETRSIHVRHRSLAEFLTNPNGCIDKNLLVNATQQHNFLTVSCFREMEASLRANICWLNPLLLLSEVGILQDKISINVPKRLAYAVYSWARHISCAAPDRHLLSLLRKFFAQHFPMWLEVLSVLGYIKSCGQQSLIIVEDWIKVCAMKFRQLSSPS
jgi:hypothetical protein